MNTALFKQTVKENCGLWLAMTVLQRLMLFGMGMNSTVAMSAISYYNMLPEIFLAIYVVITASGLIAAKVERGTMVYVLSTPIKRSKVVMTQAIYLIVSLFLMFLISAVCHIIATSLSAGGLLDGDVSKILFLNLGLFALGLAYSGICFLASSIFNTTKQSSGLGGAIVGAQIIFPIVAMFSANYAFLKYLTLSTLFDIQEVMTGDEWFLLKMAILAVIGLVFYGVSIVAFKERDLPL
jgi:ABC-2 type transport system permease protein